MQDFDYEGMREKIIAFLQARAGIGVRIGSVSNALGISYAMAKGMLVELVHADRIQSTIVQGRAGFMVANEHQKQMAQIARTTVWTPELRISKSRQELYERLEAERKAYPSIG